MNIKEYLNQNTNIVFILSLLGALVAIVFISIIWLLPNGPEPAETEWKCLGEDEVAGYRENEKKNEVRTATIFVKDKENGEEKYSFEINNILDVYHSIELHECGIYALRVFNYNPKKSKQDIGYKDELWKYDYIDQEESVVLLSEKLSDFISYYSPSFRVSPSEQYVVLERGYGGRNDYALIIKDLETKEDIFTLPMQEVFEKNPNIIGSFMFHEWTKDSRYFWGDIFAGANVSGYFRIDIENQTYELFEALAGQLGGEVLNVEKGLVTHRTGAFWTGVHEFTEQIKEGMREDGIGTKLYIYNLFTKKKTLIYETDEPNWTPHSWWISDTELRYETFEGEIKIYEVE